MSTLTKSLIKKLLSQFQVSFNEEINFFKKPQNLIALSLLSLSILNKFISKYKKKLSNANINSSNFPINLDDDRELQNYIKNDKALNTIINYNSNALDNDILSSIIINCQKGILIEEQSSLTPEIFNIINNQNFNAQDFINIIHQSNDIDIKTNSGFSSLRNKINVIYKDVESLLPYTFLLYFVIKLSIELLSQSDYPSTYRTKYIQKTIRNFMGLIKNSLNDINSSLKSQFNDILQTLKTLDSLIIGTVLLSTIYIKNRKTLQEESTKILKEEVLNKTCTSLDDASTFDNIEISKITNIPSLDKIDCSLNDSVIVPKKPFEEKVKNVTCDTSIGKAIAIINEVNSQDLSTSIIVENLTSHKLIFKKNININSYLTPATPIGTINNITIFSPVNGYVDSKDASSIIIRDYSDNDTNQITDNINSLNNKYVELNNTQLFIKDYFINSLYPVMLNNAPIISIADSSLVVYARNRSYNSNVKTQYDLILNSYKTLNDNFNLDVQNITGADHVKKICEDEQLPILKEEFDSLNNIFYSNIKNLGNTAINKSKTTFPLYTEFTLLDYYLNLGISLNIIKKPNNIEISFRDQINTIIEQRYVIDKYDSSKILKLINSFLSELEKSTTYGTNYNDLLNIYRQTYVVKNVEYKLNEISNKNTVLDDNEKEKLILKIMYLFNFYISISQFYQKYKNIKTSQKQATINEANYISNFFNNLWKKYNSLPKEINNTIKNISNAYQFIPYSSKVINDTEYRYYAITEDNGKCIQPTDTPDDSYLTPNTKNDYGSINYWLKYCAFATLTSVINPITGWSTGIILPSGPLQLPVIYIPIKPIKMSYGFIVFGLTICGIFPFPWVLMANYSSEYNTPLGNPTQPIKNQINALKKEISNELKNLKQSVLKGYLDRISSEVAYKELEIKTMQYNITNWRENKPPANSKNAIEYVKWVERNIILKESLTELKVEKWKLELKYKIVYQVYKLGTSTKSNDKTDVALNNIEQNEKRINSKLDSLTSLAEKASLILAPLPITLDVESANFGLTAKNPKPVIQIADKINDNINEPILDEITNSFKVKNNSLGTSNFKSSLSNSILNSKAYRTAIKASKLLIITKDPFPKYENLNLLNVRWLEFLLTDWVPTGAKSFGIPGQQPIPT